MGVAVSRVTDNDDSWPFSLRRNSPHCLEQSERRGRGLWASYCSKISWVLVFCQRVSLVTPLMALLIFTGERSG